MRRLFEDGDLRDYLRTILKRALDAVEGLPEDEVLSRSTDDLVADLSGLALLDALVIGEERVGGEVEETLQEVRDEWGRGSGRVPVTIVRADYPYSGSKDLFLYRPSTRMMTTFEAFVSRDTVSVRLFQNGSSLDPVRVEEALGREIGRIRQMAEHANKDVRKHNEGVPAQVRRAVEVRKERVQGRRGLAGALGFPLERRSSGPKAVPLERRPLGVHRTPVASGAYKDEWALSDAQYEDALDVICGQIRAWERTPSVAAGAKEEHLRDHLLVQLNGMFKGTATGETFVQAGKTDILIRVDDRHVFVGECKWWTGPKGCAVALDQLLSYLPWRDEKAALILFINRKDASSVIEKADTAIREHHSFKRTGMPTADPNVRRDFVLGHPDDLAREIKLSVLFAVLATA